MPLPDLKQRLSAAELRAVHVADLPVWVRHSAANVTDAYEHIRVLSGLPKLERCRRLCRAADRADIWNSRNNSERKAAATHVVVPQITCEIHAGGGADGNDKKR